MDPIRRILLVAAIAALAGQARAETGVTDNEIRLGTIGPSSGVLAAFGEPIQRGLRVYWGRVNERGGIHGRRVRLISEDDTSSPPRAMEAARKLVEQDQVFALFNVFGAPANLAIRPYANTRKVPQLFAASSSSLLANPVEFPWTMGWEPPNEIEAVAFVRHILEKQPKPVIALLTTNDAAGNSYRATVSPLLKEKGAGDVVPIVVTADASPGALVDRVKSAKATAVIVDLVPNLVPIGLGAARQLGASLPRYVRRSPASLSSPVPTGRFSDDQPEGIITSAYLKDPGNPLMAGSSGVSEWRKWMGDPRKEDTAAYVYAYAVSETMRHVLQASGRELTRETLLAKATSLKGLSIPMLIDGIVINTDKLNYMPIRSVALQQFTGGEQWKILAVIQSGGGGGCPGGGQRCANGQCPPCSNSQAP